MRFICLFLIPLFAIPTSCQGQSWDRFRGPNGCGVVEANLPTTWSDTENLAWSSDLPGRGSSSPVVWDGNIYLTSYSGYGASLEAPGDRSALRLHVLCVDLQDGSVNWTCTLGPDAAEQAMTKRVGEHGYASPTPCVDEDAVYVSFGPSGVAAVSHDGDLIWRRSVGTGTAGFGAAASPMLVGDLLIQNASIESGTLFALEKATGEVRWRTEGITRAWTTPTLIEGEDGTAELVVNQRDAILGIDPSTGKQRWSCDAIEDYIVPCVLHQDGLLYCSGGRSNKTFAVRPGGDGDVSESNVVWDVSLGANVTTPVLVNGNLFWSHDKAIALCLRANDGEMMFRERLPTRSRVYASIVSDGTKLFLTTRDAGVLVLAATPEYKELAVNRLGDPSERFSATPAIVGNRLLLRSETRLYCIAAP